MLRYQADATVVMVMTPLGPLEIRPSQPFDLVAITQIYREAVLNGRASFEMFPPNEAEMTRRRDALLDGGHPYLVASRGETVLGYAYAGPYRTRPAYRNTVESSVYINREARGQGLGRLLLDAIVSAATDAGFRQMVAIVGDSEHTASIRLHEAAGFRLVGILRSVGRKHETWVDTVILQRALGAGADKPPDREPPGPQSLP